MRQGHRLMLAAATLLVAGCATKGSQRAIAQAGETRAVDPVADNRSVVGQLTPGLVMQLQIDGGTVRVSNPKLVLVPRQAQDGQDGERVVVSGWRGGERITTTSIPDERINAQENVGTVIREQRTLNVALPTPRRIDVVEVAVAGTGEPQRFGVAPVYDRVVATSPARSSAADAHERARCNPVRAAEEMRVKVDRSYFSSPFTCAAPRRSDTLKNPSLAGRIGGSGRSLRASLCGTGYFQAALASFSALPGPLGRS
jgi:hypothetical protein